MMSERSIPHPRVAVSSFLMMDSKIFELPCFQSIPQAKNKATR